METLQHGLPKDSARDVLRWKKHLPAWIEKVFMTLFVLSLDTTITVENQQLFIQNKQVGPLFRAAQGLVVWLLGRLTIFLVAELKQSYFSHAEVETTRG